MIIFSSINNSIMTNIFLINQTAGYIVTLILSFVIIIPISFHLSNFKGNCSLFTRGTFIEDDGRFEPDWASCFYCGWTLFVGIITLIASFVQIIRMIRFIKNGADRYIILNNIVYFNILIIKFSFRLVHSFQLSLMRY